MHAADELIASLGFPEAYRVGGSVRDELLGRRNGDSDYVVRGVSLASVEHRLRDMNIRFRPLKLRDGRRVGVRFVKPPVELVELVLPRKEVSTGAGHRDFEIVCDPNITLEEDAQRRDFTINALYRDVVTGEVHDPLGGRDDLHYRWIRTTHPDSFRDDPLRTLRGLRFASQLEFELVETTYREMVEHAGAVTALTGKGVSGTALTELEKLLMGKQPAKSLRMMRDSGVMDVLLPELSSMVGFDQESMHHDKPLDEHVFTAIQAAADRNASLRVRMALLFHDSGKPWMAWRGEDNRLHYYELTIDRIRELDAPPTAVYPHETWGAMLARAALDRLNAPAALRDDVVTLVQRHMLPLHGHVRPMKVREWRAELDDELLGDLIEHRTCDVLSKGGSKADALAGLVHIFAMHQRAIAERVPRTPKELKINGVELQGLGYRDRQIGDIQRRLLHEVMAQPKLNTHVWLVHRAGKLRQEIVSPGAHRSS